MAGYLGGLSSLEITIGAGLVPESNKQELQAQGGHVIYSCSCCRGWHRQLNAHSFQGKKSLIGKKYASICSSATAIARTMTL